MGTLRFAYAGEGRAGSDKRRPSYGCPRGVSP